MTLGNLSFLWRHTWLSKLLKFKAEEWKTVLKLFQQDILKFADPQAAWEFVEQVDRVKAAGFSPDELNWLLAADRSAKAAAKETDAARFLTGLRKELQAIQAEYDPSAIPFPDATRLRRISIALPPADVLLQKLNRDDAGSGLIHLNICATRGRCQTAVVAGLPLVSISRGNQEHHSYSLR